MTPKFTTRYNYKPEKGLINTMESKTFQECKDDCDINILYRKYLAKGFEPPNIKSLEKRYADISEAKSFEDLLNIQEDVKNLFNTLPAEIREECDYNVDTFIEVISTPTDIKEIKEYQTTIFDALGMLERKEQFAEIVQEVKEGNVAGVDPAPVPEEK